MTKQLTFEDYQRKQPIKQDKIGPEDFEAEMDRIARLPIDERLKEYGVREEE